MAFHLAFYYEVYTNTTSHTVSHGHLNIDINLGDNRIQNFQLGRYIVGYTVGNLVLRRRASGAVNVISERISDDVPPKMKFRIWLSPF